MTSVDGTFATFAPSAVTANLTVTLLSVVLTTDDVYGAFYDDYENLTAFLHSHSYTGNALACAAALATLDIFERDDVIAANRVLAEAMADATLNSGDQSLQAISHAGDSLVNGLIRSRSLDREIHTSALPSAINTS